MLSQVQLLLGFWPQFVYETEGNRGLRSGPHCAESVAGDQHGTGTCLRSDHRSRWHLPTTPQPAFPSSSTHRLQQLRTPRAGCHLAYCQCQTCQRSGDRIGQQGPAASPFRPGKELLKVYSQWAKHDTPKPIPQNRSKQPLFPSHAEALLEVDWTDSGSPTSLLGALSSHLLCEVQEQTQVKCFERCLAPTRARYG